ncbi:MAG TPA: enoyl-CoA hydratase [Caulobacteraceae bacterium]
MGPPTVQEHVISQELVLAETVGPITRLTLNDPERANVLSRAMMTALAGAIARVEGDTGVKVIVLAAAGKLFCAGHDLAELRATNDPLAHQVLFDQCSALMLAVGACRVPVIARVQGSAVAAGCQLVASCDLAFAADTAKFAVSGINLGLFCSTPGVALARAIGRKAASEMLLTGKFIGAAEAAGLGLINRAVPPAELDTMVDEAAALIAAKPADAVALGKATLRRQVEAPLAEAYALASRAMVENLSYDSARTGIDAFLRR